MLTPKYTTVRTHADTAQAARQLAFRLSAETGQRISLNEAIAAAVKVASADLDASVAALAAISEGTDR